MDKEAIREQLLAKKNELLRRVTKIDADLNHREEPVSADFAEQAVELENLEVLFALDQEGKEELFNVNNALARLDSGEYDTCQNCGNDINPERLKALPYTSLCIKCAEAMAAKQA
jgi:RNA polymerase-binding protein DksA